MRSISQPPSPAACPLQTGEMRESPRLTSFYLPRSTMAGGKNCGLFSILYLGFSCWSSLPPSLSAGDVRWMGQGDPGCMACLPGQTHSVLRRLLSTYPATILHTSLIHPGSDAAVFTSPFLFPSLPASSSAASPRAGNKNNFLYDSQGIRSV